MKYLLVSEMLGMDYCLARHELSMEQWNWATEVYNARVEARKRAAAKMSARRR